MNNIRQEELRIIDLNKEPDYGENRSLVARANELVYSKEYLQKVKMIKSGNTDIKSMTFMMDGIKIELPYNGQKVT